MVLPAPQTERWREQMRGEVERNVKEAEKGSGRGGENDERRNFITI